MTTEHERPSDELTSKVVAWWRGWEGASISRNCGISRATFHNTNLNAAQLPQTDPRGCTDTALKLLGWMKEIHFVRLGDVWLMGDEWFVGRWADADYPDVVTDRIPLSGPGLCYAIVSLAGRAMDKTHPAT